MFFIDLLPAPNNKDIFNVEFLQTWSLTLKEKHRMRFENRVVKRDELTGGWRKLYIRNFMTCTLRQV
jgi:hypothetical protein